MVVDEQAARRARAKAAKRRACMDRIIGTRSAVHTRSRRSRSRATGSAEAFAARGVGTCWSQAATDRKTPAWKSARVQARGGSSSSFTRNAGLAAKSTACAENIATPLGTIRSSATHAHGSRLRSSARIEVERAKPSRRRSNAATVPDQQREAGDMDDLDDRIEPERVLHRAGERRVLERLEQGSEIHAAAGGRGATARPAARSLLLFVAVRALLQRSSTVLPWTMMRSARISSGLLRF